MIMTVTILVMWRNCSLWIQNKLNLSILKCISVLEIGQLYVRFINRSLPKSLYLVGTELNGCYYRKGKVVGHSP